MLTRKCDICGAEMRMTTPRYKVVFDGWLYKSEKDICVSCFERIKAEIQQADTPQTDERQELEAYRKCIKSRSFWDAKHCDDCMFYDDCPFNPREDEDEPQFDKDINVRSKDEPQTDCPKSCPTINICTKDDTDCPWK